MSTEGYTESCKNIQHKNPHAPSGVYTIYIGRLEKKLDVYCEMGLDGGGYTFISWNDISSLTNEDIQAMHTDKTTFLMRVRKCNNLQPYIVLKQLSQYRSIPLTLSLNDHSRYAAPVNLNLLGQPYLYFGFLPVAHAANRNIQGVWANGKEFTFRNGDSNPNSHFTLFANFKETQPTSYSLGVEWPFINQVMDSAIVNPSKREMPVEYFYFMETHFGGGGCYTQTDSRLDKKCISSVAIGFK